MYTKSKLNIESNLKEIKFLCKKTTTKFGINGNETISDQLLSCFSLRKNSTKRFQRVSGHARVCIREFLYICLLCALKMREYTSGSLVKNMIKSFNNYSYKTLRFHLSGILCFLKTNVCLEDGLRYLFEVLHTYIWHRYLLLNNLKLHFKSISK